MIVPEEALTAANQAIITNRTLRGAVEVGLEAAAPHIQAEALRSAANLTRDVHGHITEGGHGYNAGFHYALTVIDSIADEINPK